VKVTAIWAGNPLWNVSMGDVSCTERSVIDLQAELPELRPADLGGNDDGTLTFRVEVAGRMINVERPVRASVRRTIGKLDQALAGFEQAKHQVIDRDVVRATLEHDRERLLEFISSGDKDVAATVEEAAEVDSPRSRRRASMYAARSGSGGRVVGGLGRSGAGNAGGGGAGGVRSGSRGATGAGAVIPGGGAGGRTSGSRSSGM
jgi:hypothetical protein